MEIVGYSLAALGVYLALGVLFACWFVIGGVGCISPASRGSGWVFRALILPGSAAMWPLLAWELVASRGAGGVVVGRAVEPDDVETAVESTAEPAPHDQGTDRPPPRGGRATHPAFVDPEAETSA